MSALESAANNISTSLRHTKAVIGRPNNPPSRRCFVGQSSKRYAYAKANLFDRPHLRSNWWLFSGFGLPNHIDLRVAVEFLRKIKRVDPAFGQES